MNFTYLGEKNWKQITREERVFCFELFEVARKNPIPLLKLIQKDITNIQNLEIGIEVCFYRDFLFAQGIKVRDTKFPPKRTFDLAIFLENEMIIIEAKVSQGFSNKQLDSIKNDKGFVRELLKKENNNPPKITTLAIYSSNYNISEKTKSFFDYQVTWKKLARIFDQKKEVFQQADRLYPPILKE